MKYLFPLIFLAACATTKETHTISSPDKVTKEDFKKERPLSNSQVADYYDGIRISLSPALQDETVDRFTDAELAKVTPSTDPLLDMALRCQKGDYQGGFNVAAQYFNRYQKVAIYWNQVANCHLKSGNPRKALLFYNKALEVSPDYIPALNNIGVMYSRQGQDQKALIAFERATKKAKFSKTPRYNLARLYLTYGLTESAQPIFESLLNESPKDVDLLNAVGTAYFFQSDYRKAMSFYQSIPKNEWKRAEIGLNLALTLKKLGNLDEGQKVLSQVGTPRNAKLKRYYKTVEEQLGAR